MAGIKKVRARKIKKNIDDKLELNSVKMNDEKKRDTNLSAKKMKNKKIRMSFSKAEEQKMDKAMEREDNVSVMVMVIILALCFIVGISLGYILYRIAINGVI